MHWFIKFILGFLVLILLWLLISEALPRILPIKQVSNSQINGLILRRQEWSGEIKVVGDLITLPGAKITVLPGTKIIISRDGDRSNFDFLPWHLKSGLNTGEYYHGVYNGELFWDERQKIHLYFSELIALGSREQPIIITSNSPTGQDSPYDINSIYIDKGVLSNVSASNYRRLELGDKVTVRDSKFLNTAECSICSEFGSPSIIKNSFDKSLREYIWLKSSDASVTDNIFLNSAPVGVMIEPQFSGKANISHNDFEMPKGVSINVLSGDEEEGGVISFNAFVGGSKIIMPCDSKIKITQNNLQALLTFQKEGCDKSFNLGSNYWGTLDKNVVLREKVVKDPKLNLVIDPPLLVLPPVGPRN